MNKKDEYKRIITIVLLTTFLTLIVCYPYSYQNKNKNNIIYINPEQTSVNYIGLLELGLVPNSPSRIPNHKDKFTHIIINKNGNQYALFKSYNWDTRDYGRTFTVRIKDVK